MNRPPLLGAYGMVPARAMFDPYLTDSEFRTLALLYCHAMAQRNFIVDPLCTQQYLAEERGISQSAIAEQISTLEKRGYIEKTRAGFPAKLTIRCIRDQPDLPEEPHKRRQHKRKQGSEPSSVIAPSAITGAAFTVIAPEAITDIAPEAITDIAPEAITVLIRDSESHSERDSERARGNISRPMPPPRSPKLDALAHKWANSREGVRWREGMRHPFDWSRTNQKVDAFREWLEWNGKTVEEVAGELVIA